MREYTEDLETRILATYAVKSKETKGREHDEPNSCTRTCFQRDRDRIVHSKAFRRLKQKTQVFLATESDHYRSRLTHTIEVAQISRHIARYLQLNEDLTECIALAHDLGHTPFGHAGERELNRLMKDHGGFEHNLQSRRIVDFIEQKYPLFPGLNLSFEVREGLLKHSSPWDDPDNDQSHTNMEAQVVNLADEIAYNNHDLDDGLTSDILNEKALSSEVEIWNEAKEAVRSKYTNLSLTQLKHLINSHIISSQVLDVVQETKKNILCFGIDSLNDVQNIKQSVVSFSLKMKKQNQELRKYLAKHFYHHPSVSKMNIEGQEMIGFLFNSLVEKPSKLPSYYQERVSEDYPIKRVVSDYVAGMTDSFAIQSYQSLSR